RPSASIVPRQPRRARRPSRTGAAIRVASARLAATGSHIGSNDRRSATNPRTTGPTPPPTNTPAWVMADREAAELRSEPTTVAVSSSGHQQRAEGPCVADQGGDERGEERRADDVHSHRLLPPDPLHPPAETRGNR